MLLEGLKCSFGGPVNQHDSVGTRSAVTLPHVQQKAFRTALWVNTAGGREKSL